LEGETFLNSVEKVPNSGQEQYGGFWIRVAAYVIDSLIVGIPLALLSILVIMVFFIPTGAFEMMSTDSLNYEMTEDEALLFLGTYLGAWFVVIIINLIITVAYFAGLHASKWQATVGKKLLGLQVTDLNGKRITFWRAFGRYLAMSFLSGIFMYWFYHHSFYRKKTISS